MNFFRTNEVHHFDPPESQHVSISYNTSRKVRIANQIYTRIITGLLSYCSSPMIVIALIDMVKMPLCGSGNDMEAPHQNHMQLCYGCALR